jgi:hypothetical protein
MLVFCHEPLNRRMEVRGKRKEDVREKGILTGFLATISLML